MNFEENKQCIQIKYALSKSKRVLRAKFYVCKKLYFFSKFDRRTTLTSKCHGIKTQRKKIVTYIIDRKYISHQCMIM